MKISYKKLWVQLIERDIKKVDLQRDLGISAGTMSKLNKGEEVSLSILLRICDYLNCDIMILRISCSLLMRETAPCSIAS